MSYSQAKQDWAIGNTVKVGFLTLTVVGKTAAPNGGPHVYQLHSANGKCYEFQPHNGLVRL